MESHQRGNSQERKERTLISLCSRNCKITFLRYSRLTSSSFFDSSGEPSAGELVLDGDSEDTDEIEVRVLFAELTSDFVIQ
jgi:hypothetical protein